VGVVNVRANLLDAGDLLDQASLDKYSFARDVYLQRRRSLIRPGTAEKEERFDLPEDAQNAPAGGTPVAPATDPATAPAPVPAPAN
jgi:phospholipid-binding lipoprotein MlaA